VKSFYVVKLSFNESELDTKQESSSYLLLYIGTLQTGTLKSDLNNLTTNLIFTVSISFFLYIDFRERKTRGHERGHYEAIERRRLYTSNVRAEASEERKKKATRKCRGTEEAAIVRDCWKICGACSVIHN